MAHKNNTKELIEDILFEAIDQWLSDNDTHDQWARVLYDEQEDVWLEYEGKSKHAFGSFLLQYKPQEAAEKLYGECERLFDEFKIKAHLLDENRNITVYIKDHLDDNDREKVIKEVAWMAILTLITSMKINIGDALKRSFEDGVIFADASLNNIAAAAFKGQGAKNVDADIRSDIKEAAKKAAKERKETLSQILQNFPYILAKRESGRPKESRDNSHKHQERINKNWRRFVAAVHALGDALARTNVRGLLAQKIGISIRTLDRWLTRDFDMPLDIAIRRAQKQTNKGQKN